MSLNFPAKIYQILENESGEVVSWHSNGTAFRIMDHTRFEREIIPRYFRHNQLSSVQRQLNLYGFKCITRGDDKGAYYHPQFKRGDWEIVKRITRYNNTTNKKVPLIFAPWEKPSLEKPISALSNVTAGAMAIGSNTGSSPSTHAAPTQHSSNSNMMNFWPDPLVHTFYPTPFMQQGNHQHHGHPMHVFAELLPMNPSAVSASSSNMSNSSNNATCSSPWSFYSQQQQQHQQPAPAKHFHPSNSHIDQNTNINVSVNIPQHTVTIPHDNTNTAKPIDKPVTTAKTGFISVSKTSVVTIDPYFDLDDDFDLFCDDHDTHTNTNTNTNNSSNDKAEDITTTTAVAADRSISYGPLPSELLGGNYMDMGVNTDLSFDHDIFST